MEYTPLAEYGLLGNVETCSLVGSDGSIDWFPVPELASPSVFAAILDTDRGGHFALRPAGEYASEQSYVSRTNVLETEFETPTGRITLTDFMPVTDNERTPELPTRAIYDGSSARKARSTSPSTSPLGSTTLGRRRESNRLLPASSPARTASASSCRRRRRSISRSTTVTMATAATAGPGITPRTRPTRFRRARTWSFPSSTARTIRSRPPSTRPPWRGRSATGARGRVGVPTPPSVFSTVPGTTS